MVYESTAQDDTRIDVAALFAALVAKLPRIIIITLALLAATFIVLMFQPRLYESSASILIEPRANSYTRASNDPTSISISGDAGIVSSEVELIKSRDTLLGVIDALDLRSNPEFNGSDSAMSPLGMIMQIAGRRAATPDSIDQITLDSLYQRLAVAQERDSRLISVAVQTTDPELSAQIANAIANAHVARRAQLSLSDTADASGWLQEEITRLRASVQQAEAAVADFKVENDLFTGQNNTSLLDQQLSDISNQITQSQQRRSDALSRASLIRGLIERNQPIEGVADVQDSVVIQRLSEEKARLQGEQAQRSATLLSNHPSIRALNAQIAELNNQIRIEGGRVAAALEAEAQIEEDLVSSLQAELARAKSSASLATRDTVTLDGLEREAKAQRDLLEAYLLRFTEASSRVDASSALPDVRVVSVAAPSVTPASPKTSLIMIGVAVVSVLLQVGGVAFGELMSGRALVPVSRRVQAQDELDEAPFDSGELEPEERWDEGQDDEPSLTGELEPALYQEDEAQDDTAEPEWSAVEPEPRIASAVSPDRTAQDQGSTDAARDFIRSLMAQPRPAAPAMDERSASEQLGDELSSLLAAADSASEPVAAVPTVRRPAPAPRSTPPHLRYADLLSDLVLGRTHLLLLADHDNSDAGRHLAETLVGDALAKGLSVALIDAGTGRRSDEPGISDLSLGAASFGDVVQKSADTSFAEVTWGQGDRIDRRSSRPATLVEALGDIYEVVIVLTGPASGRSMLDAFLELGGRVVVAAAAESQLEQADATRRALEEAGLPRVEITARSEPVAA